MSDPVYINKDAEYLFTLGGVYLEDEDFEVGMRLRKIAAHLQALDDRLHAGGVSDQFLAGKKAAYTELFERSNLPEEERTMPPSAVRVGIGSFHQIKRYPTGQTSAQLKAKEEKAGIKVPDKRLAGLEGLKLNMSSLFKAKE